MAVGFPAKTTYANGDVFSASDINDTNGTLNLLGSSVAYAAGKNRIINGNFAINQRSFTSNTTSGTYNFDRWLQTNGGTSGTLTITPQTFTPGAAPVSGYEGSTYIQCVTAAGANTNTYALLSQRIEDVRTFAGQTATVSFWAKAGSGTPKIAVETEQLFGSGGSPSSAVTTAGGTATLSTSWARYSVTVSVPSISGKTIGTTANTSSLGINLWLSAGSDFNSRASSIGLQNATFQIWGVQIEAGSTATAFQTATGTIQGELAACQRYYQRFKSDQVFAIYCVGPARNTTQADFLVPFSVPLRTSPSSVIDYASLGMNAYNGDTTRTVTALVENTLNKSQFATVVTATHAGTNFTTGNYYRLFNDNTTAGYLGFSAEL